jgi:general secretion pathway protein B
MSYILDALKRADAERERGNVPGLHARQVTVPPTPGGQGARRLIAWAALCIVALGGAAVVWLPRAPGGDGAATKPALGTQPIEAVAPRTIVATAPQIDVAPPQAAAPAPAPVAAPTMAAVSTAKLVAEPAPPVRASSPTSAAAIPKGKAPVPVPAPAQATIPLLAELPEDTRRQIPVLAITGAVYSEFAGQRMLLVNAQVLKQGSPLGADLTLEEIHPSSSVFNFRGTRFRVAH